MLCSYTTNEQYSVVQYALKSDTFTSSEQKLNLRKSIFACIYIIRRCLSISSSSVMRSVIKCSRYFTFAHTVRLLLDNLKTGKCILLSSLDLQIITTLLSGLYKIPYSWKKEFFICHMHNYNQQWNVFSAFNPSKCTHTWSSGQLTLRHPGSSRGFGALLKGLTSVVNNPDGAEIRTHNLRLQVQPSIH